MVGVQHAESMMCSPDTPPCVQHLYVLHGKDQYFHRDLKPLNVVVSGWSGEKLGCTIVDWASARHVDRREWSAVESAFELDHVIYPICWGIRHNQLVHQLLCSKAH